MTSTDSPPPTGHNNPPPFDQGKVDALTAKVAEWADAGTDWLNMETVNDAETAAKLADYINGCRAITKEIDDTRKDEKKPHLDAGRAVDAAYKGIGARLEKTQQAIQPMMTSWLKREEERKEAERKKAAEDARKQAEEAERLRQQAEARNDMAGVADAESLSKHADKLVKKAEKKQTAKAASHSGGGRSVSLRDKRVVEVINTRLLFMYFKSDEDVMAKVAEVLKSAAAAQIRGGVPADKIPGITTKVEKVAV